MKFSNNHILVTGGCGYVGSVLVPKLVQKYPVTVLDSLIFGNHLHSLPNLRIVKGDIRDTSLLRSLMPGIQAIIHLASIANDPSCDLAPAITVAVNRDALRNLVSVALESGVERFINASTSSVYGIKDEESVTEELSLEPVTLYAKTKAEGEEIVGSAASPGFETVSIRSATVCGVSPRMRFDVIVNIMTKAAIADGLITVHGGEQYRPNIHIEDITDLYAALLQLPASTINGKVFNYGATNHTVRQIARMVHEETGAAIITDSDITDNRSYRISSDKIGRELGISTRRTIRQAIQDIKRAFDMGMFPDPEASRYYNVSTMNSLMTETSAGV